MASPILEIKALSKSYVLKQGKLFQAQPVLKAVNNVSLSIEHGETFGIIGESGCGKSTLARTLVNLHSPDTGAIRLDGKPVASMSPAERNRAIQYVFQDPVGSLNPRRTIRQTLETPLRALGSLGPIETTNRLIEIMQAVNMPVATLDRYPHEFSGGQAQRIGIARALLAGSRILVLDEPVSALDVSVQAQILELLTRIKKQFNLTLIFISHDLAVVESFCDRIAVMYCGSIVEVGIASTLFGKAKHPYTNLLAKTAPRPDTEIHVEDEGELPDPLNLPTGCAFAARCPNAQDICYSTNPEPSFEKAYLHVACHFPLNQR